MGLKKGFPSGGKLSSFALLMRGIGFNYRYELNYS